MIKIFISQPMNGRSNEEIKVEREYLAYKIEEYYKHEKKESVQVIDSFIKDAPQDANSLWFLGKSLELLSTADIAVFAKGWHSARGCVIEHECAVAYGIETIEED